MSGLEFIGLALALAPLFTDAIEHHNKLLNPVRAMNPDTYREWAEDFLGDLNYEICMLKINLQKLIKELPIPDDLRARLLDLENFNRTLWRDPEPVLEEALDARLNDCADSFVKSLTTILHHLDKIVKDETLPVPIKREEILLPQTTSFRRLEQLMAGKGEKLAKRFRFGTKQDKRQKLLVKVGKHNSRLQKMLEQTSDTAPANTAPTRTRSSTMPHSHLWNCMDGFRRAMRSLCCQCDSHEVRFGLLKSTGVAEKSASFDMLMKFAHDQSGGTFRWSESKIHIALEEVPPKKPRVAFGDDEDSCAMEMMFRSNSLSDTISGSTVVSSTSSSPLSSSPTCLSSPSIVVESPEGGRTANSIDKRIEVTSLCDTIKRGLHQKACSYIVYDNDRLWHNPSPKRQEIDASHPGVTLKDILEEKKLTLKQKKILSVILASSLLWYPWQDHNVHKGSIHFHSRSGYDLTKPYTELVQLEESVAEDLDAPYRLCQNRSLLALAIMLLEIELGQKIESFYVEDDLTDGAPNVNTDFFTASRLLQEYSDDLYHGTREAIESCLQCEFGGDSTALDDQGFRQAAYEKIVLPLEDVLNRGFNMRIEDLEACEPQPVPEPKVSSVPIQPAQSFIAGAGVGSGPGPGMKGLIQMSKKLSARNLAAIDKMAATQRLGEATRQTRFVETPVLLSSR